MLLIILIKLNTLLNLPKQHPNLLSVIKTPNATSEQNLALGEQTLKAIDWQNQQLDKETKTIEQIRNKALVMSNEALMKPDLSNEAVEKTRDIAPVYVDIETANFLHEMGDQTKPQLDLNLVDLPTRRYKMNGVNLTLEQVAFIVKDKIYEMSDGFTNFLTKSNVTYVKIEEDEKKNKTFLLDIGYDIGKGDKKSSRYKTVKHILGGKKKIYGRGLTKDKLSNHSCNSSNNLTEKLELLILETKAGHDEVFDETLNMSKKLLSMNIINKEQLDKFVFNYGK